KRLIGQNRSEAEEYCPIEASYRTKPKRG
ncbi:hypothetical protein SAMN05216565_10456, partial [Litchfieldia salsa]